MWYVKDQNQTADAYKIDCFILTMWYVKTLVVAAVPSQTTVLY